MNIHGTWHYDLIYSPDFIFFQTTMQRFVCINDKRLCRRPIRPCSSHYSIRALSPYLPNRWERSQIPTDGLETRLDCFFKKIFKRLPLYFLLRLGGWGGGEGGGALTLCPLTFVVPELILHPKSLERGKKETKIR